MNRAADGFIDWAQNKWPIDWTTLPAAKTLLSALKADIRNGSATSIPIVRGQEVRWISIAPTLTNLKCYVADLSAWVPRHLCRGGGEIAPTIVRRAPAGSPVEHWISELAPEGYARWASPVHCADIIFDRLDKMRLFLASRPEVKVRRTPSLPSLRMEFVTALRIGDWRVAESCVNSLDQWGLDQAASTLQMRLRLLDAMGDEHGVIELARRHKAWDFPNPRRIASAILRAVYSQEIMPIEVNTGFVEALNYYESNWHPLLHQTVADAGGDNSACNMLAYSATIDRDTRKFHALRQLLPVALGDFLCEQLPCAELESGAASAPPSPAPPVTRDRRFVGTEFWKELHSQVRSEDVAATRALLAAIDADIWDDPATVVAVPDAVLEVLSDPDIGGSNVSRSLQQEVITTLIDAFLAVPNFPRLSHLHVYQALLDGLVALNSESANEAESQLVLGLVGAVINLSADACMDCEDVIRAWWRRRPIIERLNWLLASLDVLAPLHTDADRLADLFYDGLTLAARKSRALTVGEVDAWRRVGRLIELPIDVIEDYLEPITNKSKQVVDYLAEARLTRIAIVSLAEAGAKEATRELERRTGAEVFIVNSIVAGRETRHATGADLILYVWAASTHATFRAFDNHRNRVAFVQGTGPASIVLAAERWAEKKAAAQPQ
jgi:hypothetical protein